MTESQTLKATFDRFDSDGDGTINEAEFIELLRALEFDASRQDAATAFSAIDVTSNQRIEFGEFAAWWASVQ
jgi:Ca2+-binding EF-hand superfamily protein